MILVIDNYDSFSYNLVQMLGDIYAKHLKENEDSKKDQGNISMDERIDEQMKVVRNNKITIPEIEAMHPTHIILSPGPGRPKDAGICEEVIKQLKGKYKILGVCLGHQAICEVFGATITYAKKLMHGKQSVIAIDPTCPIFHGLEETVTVGRYHSLAADAKTIPSELQIIAEDEMKEVMAVKHKKYEIYGLQFHPESILTPSGRTMLENFLNI